MVVEGTDTEYQFNGLSFVPKSFFLSMYPSKQMDLNRRTEGISQLRRLKSQRYLFKKGKPDGKSLRMAVRL